MPITGIYRPSLIQLSPTANRLTAAGAASGRNYRELSSWNSNSISPVSRYRSPDWHEANPDELYQGVRENSVHHYGFPETRLTLINESECETRAYVDPTDQETSPPQQFVPTIGRFEDNKFTVAYDAGE